MLERASPEATILKNHIAAGPPDDLATSIISYEEQTRGWLAVISQAQTPQSQVIAYRLLKKNLKFYSNIAVIDFDDYVATVFVCRKAA